MKVLNIEDDAFKHNDICKVLTSCGVNTVYWEKNYEDGCKAIKNAEDAGKPYDLIITDMYYPREAGGKEEASGVDHSKSDRSGIKGTSHTVFKCQP